MDNTGRYVYLVGELNYYKLYQVAVQAFNEFGYGPMSPVVMIRSAMGCEYDGIAADFFYRIA